jgi:hypothetical protein
MTKYNYNYDKSIQFIKNIKSDVHPNSSFVKVLNDYYATISALIDG